MSELTVYKSNELVVSRYDLTEQQTKLVLYGLSKINNTLKNPTEKDMTLSLSYDEYAKFMGISQSLSFNNLRNATKNLLSKTFELISFNEKNTPVLTMRQWFTKAEFNPDTFNVDLVFHSDLFPYIFNMKKFIKYKLKNINSLNNKYSIRMYEYFLKELGESKKDKCTFEISLYLMKTILCLDGNYDEFKRFNQRVLKVVVEDINKNTDLKVGAKRKGRPVDTLIFSVEKVKQLDLVNEIERQEQAEFPQVEPIPPKKRKTIQQETDDMRIKKLMLILGYHENSKIALSQAELGLLKNMHKHYYAHGNFVIQGKLTAKTLDFLDSVLHKYLPRLPSRKM
ncbi:replication initiation protein [Mannheimia haemolytica]|uniref:replication initiation protein n=1 Tax=Mannheimia haemolytica TaxID=75985 RepID=UPI0005CAB32C|nr:replication initiation protein [Mannheimia haemolytica]KIX30666.1 replication initiation protein [Mannheimia haemolytica]